MQEKTRLKIKKIRYRVETSCYFALQFVRFNSKTPAFGAWERKILDFSV